MLNAFVTALFVAAADSTAVPDSAALESAAGSSSVMLERPRPSRFYSVVHDLKRDRVLLFGGRDTSGARNEVWELPVAANGAGWSRLDPEGTPPEPRSQHAAIYDPAGNRMLVFGGFGNDAPLADLWSLSLGDTIRWEQLIPEGERPNPRYSPSMVLDSRRNRALILGGGDPQVWQLHLGPPLRWERFPVNGKGPGVRYGQSAVLDSVHDRILVFGGYGGYYSPLKKVSGGAPTKTHNELWELTLGDTPWWTLLSPKGALPASRGYHAAGLDPARQRMLILGGGTYYHGAEKDLWALSMNAPPRWEGQAVGTEFETPIGSGSGVIVDPARDHLLVFGGLEASDGVTRIPLAPVKFEKPKTMSPWASTLIAETFLAAYSCIGYIENGEWLVGLNGLVGTFQVIGASVSPDPTYTRESQLAAGLGWLALAGVEAEQADRHVPNNEIVLGNFIGMNAVVLAVGGVEWVARKLHGPRH